MHSKLEKEIRELEQSGVEVVVLRNGKTEYVTGGINKNKEVRDDCKHCEMVDICKPLWCPYGVR